MHRWHLFALPEGLISTLMGEAGRELLLASQRQVPAKLLADGFVFRHETVEQAIEELVRPTPVD
jgi:NAD dependent epimerase/dehydratase family enzyme